MRISILSSQHIIQVLRLINMFLSCIYTHVYLESVAFLQEAIIGYIVKREWWPLWASSAEDHNKHSIVIHSLAPSYLIMVISFLGGKEVGQGEKEPVTSPSVASQLQGQPPWPGEGARQQGPRRERRIGGLRTPLHLPSEPCLRAPGSLNLDLSTRVLTCPPASMDLNLSWMTV